jgi:hypothetical protein
MSHRYDTWAASQSDEIERRQMGLFVTKSGSPIRDSRVQFSLYILFMEYMTWTYNRGYCSGGWLCIILFFWKFDKFDHIPPKRKEKEEEFARF